MIYPINYLKLNKFESCRLVAGTSEGEVCIWDLRGGSGGGGSCPPGNADHAHGASLSPHGSSHPGGGGGGGSRSSSDPLCRFDLHESAVLSVALDCYRLFSASVGSIALRSFEPRAYRFSRWMADTAAVS